jgi:hypothetical protein
MGITVNKLIFVSTVYNIMYRTCQVDSRRNIFEHFCIKHTIMYTMLWYIYVGIDSSEDERCKYYFWLVESIPTSKDQLLYLAKTYA